MPSDPFRLNARLSARSDDADIITSTGLALMALVLASFMTVVFAALTVTIDRPAGAVSVEASASE